jgi:hypothetical protein
MGQTLRFYARADFMVNARPGETLRIGMPVPRIGRDHLPDGSLPASKEVFECDSESACGRNALHSMRVKPRNPPLWPADEATAAACGVPFTPVEWVDGEWLPKKSKATKPAPNAA